MERYANYSRILATGKPAPFALIGVHPRGSGAFASIFEADGTTPKANPFQADENGYFFFLAANGRYDIALSSGGIVTPYSWPDILLSDTGGSPGAVVQAQLGGSRFQAPDVAGSPATVDAVNYMWVLLPGTNDGPPNLQAELVVECKVATGSSVTVRLVDDGANVIVSDPDPFIDDSQFVQHTIVVPLSANGKVVKLQAVVTNGDALPGPFFVGDIRYSIVNP